MEKFDRIKAAIEWNEILKKHPSFARVFLAQQVILMEASELGIGLVERSMCELLSAGYPILFNDYWEDRCKKQQIGKVYTNNMIDCLKSSSRDPARCFDNPHDWFDDPLAKGRTLPPKPPIPTLR
jgi:hypothetical protein